MCIRDRNENGDPQVYEAENNVTSGPARDYHALVYCGKTVPIHNASLTNVLRYKGFEFSAMLILDAGHKLRSSNIPSTVSYTHLQVGIGVIYYFFYFKLIET